jgi:hypothetical protein
LKDSKKRATAPGSYNDVQNKLRAAINEKFQSDPNFNKSDVSYWPVDIIPDQIISAGQVVVENYTLDKYYKIPFTFNQDGTTTLGEPVEVQQTLTYDPVEKGLFVKKDEAKQLVSGPVAIPGCADCDYEAGEKILTADEIEEFVHAFNTKFRLSDKMHVFTTTGELIGETVENWTTKEESTVKNILGEEVTLPEGTWMTTIKVTDKATWDKIEDGTYKGFSAAYLSESDANNLLDAITASKSMQPYKDYVGANKRVLIKDLENPVPVTVSIVDRPCVSNAIFTSVKACPSSGKAGRSISNVTHETLQAAYDAGKQTLDNLKSLLDKAKGERQTSEEIDMNKEELGQLMDEKLTPLKEDIDGVKKSVKKLEDGDPGGNPATVVKCTKCDHDLGEADKFCPECGDKIEGKPTEVESLKATVEKQKEELDTLKEQVNKSNDLSGNTDPGKTPVSNKRDINGVPSKKVSDL